MSIKILSANQIRQTDLEIIRAEGIRSVDLMERAAEGCVRWIAERFTPGSGFLIFCGTGNNGGDGLAIARLLHLQGHQVRVIVVRFGSGSGTPDFETNLIRLRDLDVHVTDANSVQEVVEMFGNSQIENSDENVNRVNRVNQFNRNYQIKQEHQVIIDALTGTGLSRPPSGFLLDTIRIINTLPGIRISIDLPSGMPSDLVFNAESNEMISKVVVSDEKIVRANYTLSFITLKITQLMPQTGQYVGELHLIDLGADPEFLSGLPSDAYLIQAGDVGERLVVRPPFAHKGHFGHVLLAGGSRGMMGAMVLSARAGLRSGCGLLTTLVPACGLDVMQVSVPEAIVWPSEYENFPGGESKTLAGNSDEGNGFPNPDRLSVFSAAGVGPGMGTNPETAEFLARLLAECKAPMVLDADALNIISAQRKLLDNLPPRTILTPHPGEFRRLAGTSFRNDTEEHHELLRFSSRYDCVVVLKGHRTRIALPGGTVYFNSTGNSGMATAGSGDVLTGIISGLLAQGLSPEDAAISGVFLHGLAGDMAAENIGPDSMLASDIITFLPEAIRFVRNC